MPNDTNVDVETFKTAYRIDGNDDDHLIKLYLDAANSFVKNAVGSDDTFFDQPSVKAAFETAVLAYAGTLYQYRASVSDVQPYEVNSTCNSIIGQLRGKYASFEEEQDAQENNSEHI